MSKKSLSFICFLATAVWMQAKTELIYKNEVEPLLNKYCVDCHGPDKQKNDVRVDNLDLDFVSGRDRETWHDILDLLHLGDMPPEDEAQPSDGERRTLVDWITEEMTRASEIRRSTNGLGVLRRMTRYEYNNTMSDLLGVELDYATNLPPETASHDGFQNNGSVMGMSSMQLEYYLKAAQYGLSVALVEGEQPIRYEAFTTTNAPRRADRPDPVINTSKIQPGNSFWLRMMDYPTTGPVTVKVKAHAVIPEGKGPPRMRVRVGLRPDTYVTGGTVGEDIDIWDTAEEPGTYTFHGRLEHYPMLSVTPNFPGFLVNVHNIYDDGGKAMDIFRLRINEQYRELNDPDPEQPWLVVESVSLVVNEFESWPPKHHTDILHKGFEVPKNETAYAKEVLTRFMTKAYRRPPTKSEVNDILSFYKEVRPVYPSFIDAMRQALSMVLISPQFLYLVEPLEEGEGTRKLNGYEVASRLSYFLWSTMPDDELLSLAKNKKILRASVLKKQVQRMLEAPQAKRFVEQFTDQWLDLQALERVAVNPQFYPDFNERVVPPMREESQAFFSEVLYNDLSALNFLDSDFTMLNEILANHYGIEGVTGNAMRPVPLLPEHRRGGLVTQASMLVGNSTGEDSHPIDRAVWILERLLDDPPSPPPANVPSLDPETPGFAQMTLKEQLEIHRLDPACGDCHKNIDPWGIPLENFDAVGLFRNEALRLVAEKKGQTRNKKELAAVDASDVMPDGHEIQGPEALKAYLLSEKEDQFAEALVRKLTTYALGRSLEFTDREQIDHLTKEFKKDDYRLDDLIDSIVTSKLFLTR